MFNISGIVLSKSDDGYELALDTISVDGRYRTVSGFLFKDGNPTGRPLTFVLPIHIDYVKLLHGPKEHPWSLVRSNPKIKSLIAWAPSSRHQPRLNVIVVDPVGITRI